MNFLYRIYFALPNFARIGIVGKAINRILGMILKRIFDTFVPAYLKRTAHKAGYGLNSEARDEKYIVSLTSFPARIDEIWITIETILRQSFKPDKIILWLGKDQFSSVKLPQSLTNQKSRGLSIEFVEDLRSHTKYYYALQRYPDAIVITLDDDVYYPKDTLKQLVALHRHKPGVICANRVHKITFRNKIINPYRKWAHNYKGNIRLSHELLLTGVSGVLYPPKSLHPDVFDQEVFSEKCYFADDIWLMIQAIRNKTKVFTGDYFNKDMVVVSKSQKIRLLNSNSHHGGNDEQLSEVLIHYKIDLKNDIQQ